MEGILSRAFSSSGARTQDHAVAPGISTCGQQSMGRCGCVRGVGGAHAMARTRLTFSTECCLARDSTAKAPLREWLPRPPSDLETPLPSAGACAAELAKRPIARESIAAAILVHTKHPVRCTRRGAPSPARAVRRLSSNARRCSGEKASQQGVLPRWDQRPVRADSHAGHQRCVRRLWQPVAA
jgi:hypothetical protein